MARESPRRSRLGVRPWVTLVATSVVAGALVLTAVGLWMLVRSSLYGGLHEAAAQDAGAASAMVDRGGRVGELDDDRLTQVIGPDGSVTASSPGAPSDPVGRPGSLPDTVEVGGVDYVIAVDDIDGGGFVIAGRPTTSADATLQLVAVGLAVGVPLLVVLVGVVTWVGVGRALSPVERMRRQVDGVDASSLGDRVDDPGSDDEVGRLARTMNRMLDRLEIAQASQRRFVSDASHELKSPLASLRQTAELAKDHPDLLGPDELADAVLDEGARLDRLVQGLLLLAKADEAALLLNPRDVDVDDLLLEEAARQRRAGLHVDTTGVFASRVRGDAELLQQVVRNLVDNAARHSRGRLRLAVRPGTPREGFVLLNVGDDGAGIPPEDRTRIFERFVRLDDDRSRASGGSGLGLAIAAEIVHSHGGAIHVEQDPELGGALMVVELPAIV